MATSNDSPVRKLKDHQLEHLHPDQLKPYAGNARVHPPRQLATLAANIRTFGFIGAVVIDSSNNLLSGHARVEAAKRIGLERIPCIRIEHLTEPETRAYRIADNRLAELATWDPVKLPIEVRFFTELDLTFDLEIMGFATAELDILVGQTQTKAPDPTDAVPPIDPNCAAISQVGDVWRLGRHRLSCGSALEEASYARLLGQERAQLLFTDPPYNVPIAGHVSGLGKITHPEFQMGSGELSSPGYVNFLSTAFGHCATFSEDGAIHFVCIDWRHMKEMLAAGEPVYSELKNVCVWAKTNGGMGSLYRSRHELVFVWKSGTRPHINNVELGRYGRYRTNVWEYAGANSFGADRDAELAMHPTVKPIALIADAIRDCSKRGGLVLDPFAGSGSTILAAERTGRRAAAMELDPRYVDTAVRRFQDVTGDPAIHAETGLSFAETEHQRLHEPVGISSTLTPIG